ncbi:MAG: carboxypeptidase-like regulatory domain-containing protein, partial [Marinirhabdus sp.]
MKIPLYTFLFLFCATGPLFAQQATVKGRVVETNSGEALPNVTVQILNSPFKTETTATGTFNITGSRLPQGEQVIAVSKQGYMAKRIPVVVQNGSTVNLEPLLMEVDLTEVEKQIGIISLSENQLNDDNGTSFNISGLLQASNDVFFNAAAFDFSATFFRPRGLDNANGKVLINGIEMNKQFNGRPQWSNWGGLNDAMRNRDFTMGTKANDYLFGDLAGTTNITMRASQYRKGGRVSYASSNRSYRGRVIGSYNSGQSASGWAYSVLLSRRFGDEGYQEGTLYDANAFFASVEKKLNSAHSLNLTAFYTPNRRGRATAITQEVKDLKGTRYNPNWGLLNGEMRNTNVREVKEPVFMLNHYWELSDKTKLNTNVAFQTGKTGSTRIDNGGTRLLNFGGQESYVGGARNPFPNYYQRLPSFFLQDAYPTPSDFQNAYAAAQEFRANGQFDWHALYLANSIVRESGGNSIYAVQEDRSDDTQISANTIFTSNISDNITLNGSINYRNLKSENFAELKDLLGGTGYLDVDFFAEDDVNIIVGDIAQSDLRNRNRIVAQGDRYKYNYELNANVASAFGQAQFKYNTIDFFVGGMFSQAHYQRNGLYENGNFPGARSFGPSEKLKFSNFGVKAGATYKISGRHLIDVNAAYFTKAPNLRNSFSNARQNNDAVIGLTEETVTGLGASYIFRSPIVKARLTGFYNTIKD